MDRPPHEIPVIDLFAGPGGLGEGFSAYSTDEQLSFRIRLSIEYEAKAWRTLRLRSFFRQFDREDVPAEYYEYIRGEIDEEELFGNHPEQFASADTEAWHAELGKVPFAELNTRISEALNGSKDWLLIGGPPCQGYSLVGRSRLLGGARNEIADQELSTDEAEKTARAAFDSDHRHLLYREYLKIIAVHQPSVFVMENVKGMLSSTHRSKAIFESILQDLSELTCPH